MLEENTFAGRYAAKGDGSKHGSPLVTESLGDRWDDEPACFFVD
jgi:hypothetical protein